MNATDHAARLAADEDATAAFSAGLLHVPSEVATELDRILNEREAARTRARQRRSALRRHARRMARRPDGGSPVYRLRAERQWTQTDLARVAGVSPSVIWEAENRPENLHPRSWARLARALRVGIGDLYPEA